MKLASVISTWMDTLCILPYCIDNHLQFSDAVIVVGSSKSNHDISSSSYADFVSKYPPNPRVIFESCEPIKGMKPLANETRKRNFGLSVAKAKGFTHFIIGDADEFYIPEQMNKLFAAFAMFKVNGFVHPVRAYLTPTLYCDDHTLVAGIHKLNNDTFCGNYPYYPFAYDSKGAAHIDPSRRLHFREFVHMTDVICHHYTLVRKYIDLKIDNSTANSLRHNRELIHEELKEAKAGNISKLYHKEIKESDNLFNLPIWSNS